MQGLCHWVSLMRQGGSSGKSSFHGCVLQNKDDLPVPAGSVGAEVAANHPLTAVFYGIRMICPFQLAAPGWNLYLPLWIIDPLLDLFSILTYLSCAPQNRTRWATLTCLFRQRIKWMPVYKTKLRRKYASREENRRFIPSDSRNAKSRCKYLAEKPTIYSEWIVGRNTKDQKGFISSFKP